MERKQFFIANWKMHKTCGETKSFIEQVQGEAYLAPPFTALATAVESAKGSQIHIGAQNLSDQASGAFTGEVSGEMLKDLGVSFVLIGHSERRTLYHESDEMISRKIHRALENGLMPVICIGESAAQRQAGQTHHVLETQLKGALSSFTTDHLASFVLAYEPVWAIGTGVSATPDMAQETHKEVRRIIGELFSEEAAMRLPILYGGSVKPENSAELMAEPDIDGALIGGASLVPDSYTQIVKKGLQS